MATKRTAKGEQDPSQQAQAKGGAAAGGNQGSAQAKKNDGAERKAGPGPGPGPGPETETEMDTGTLDIHYNLVSVLYHALQGAALYAEFAEDAEAEGDTELAEFFTEIQDEERDRAERAKEYLMERLSSSMGESAGVDEDDDDEEEGASASV